MAFIKNDVTDDELDKLFNNNDSSGFKSKDSNDNVEEELLSDELDVKKESNLRIERPDDYIRNTERDNKINERRKESDLLETLSKTGTVSGQVTTKVFNELAKIREQAYLEEYIESQKKIPRIKEDAKIKLYSGSDECKFHVYRPYQMIDEDHMMTCCKYCSESKIFTLQDWMKYQLENKEYI